MPQPALIAADSNVLLDYAQADEIVIDCFDLLRERLPGSSVLVLPTVISELADLVEAGPDERTREAARTALRRVRRPWNFRPVNLIPAGHGIVQRIAETLNFGLALHISI